MASRSPWERLDNQSKWGFIIYRCDYWSDDAWKEFLNGWSELTKTNLRRLNAPHLIPTLDFTVREDRRLLDGASVERVQELFTEWTMSEEVIAEEKDAREKGTWAFSRYWFCVHVDGPALDGCLHYLSLPQEKQFKYLIRPESRKEDIGQTPYVNIVEKRVEVIGDPTREQEQEDEEEEEEEEAEVIAVKMHLPLVLPDAYSVLMRSLDLFDNWARYPERDGVCLI